MRTFESTGNLLIVMRVRVGQGACVNRTFAVCVAYSYCLLGGIFIVDYYSTRLYFALL